MTALMTDSDTGPDSPRGTDRDNRHLRQISPRVYHASDPNDGTVPSFPPRIARIRGQRRIASPRLVIACTPALEAPTIRGPTSLEETPTAPLTQQSIKTTTAATLAAIISTWRTSATCHEPQPPLRATRLQQPPHNHPRLVQRLWLSREPRQTLQIQR